MILVATAAMWFMISFSSLWALPPDPSASPLYWVEIPAIGREARSQIAASGVAIEEVSADRIGAFARLSDLKRLEDLGISVAKKLLLDEEAGPAAFPEKDGAYHDYSEVQTELLAVVAANPELASMFSIGQSLQGRELFALRFNSSAKGASVSDKPGIVFTGSHHAREHLSTEVPLLLGKWLSDNKDRPDVKQLLETRDIFIIPLINPDGAEYDHASGRYLSHRKNMRKNADGSLGVDLNRNYGYHWNTGGASHDPSSETYHGPSAFSEPETLAVKNFVEAHPNLKVLLSYHTFSELILYPWGDTYEPISDERAAKAYQNMAGQMAEWTGYTSQQSSELYLTSGDTTDWAWGEKKIFSFTFELSPSRPWQGGFYPGSGIIQSTFLANVKSALYLIDLADDPYRAATIPIKIPLPPVDDGLLPPQ